MVAFRVTVRTVESATDWKPVKPSAVHTTNDAMTFEDAFLVEQLTSFILSRAADVSNSTSDKHPGLWLTVPMITSRTFVRSKPTHPLDSTLTSRDTLYKTLRSWASNCPHLLHFFRYWRGNGNNYYRPIILMASTNSIPELSYQDVPVLFFSVFPNLTRQCRPFTDRYPSAITLLPITTGFLRCETDHHRQSRPYSASILDQNLPIATKSLFCNKNGSKSTNHGQGSVLQQKRIETDQWEAGLYGPITASVLINQSRTSCLPNRVVCVRVRLNRP